MFVCLKLKRGVLWNALVDGLLQLGGAEDACNVVEVDDLDGWDSRQQERQDTRRGPLSSPFFGDNDIGGDGLVRLRRAIGIALRGRKTMVDVTGDGTV